MKKGTSSRAWTLAALAAALLALGAAWAGWAPAASADDEGTAFLGVSASEETENSEGGARVVGVVPGSAAETAGIKEGDVIQRFDGDVIRGPGALTERIHSKKPGDRVEISVLRDGRQQTLDVELGERPEGPMWFSAHADPEQWEEFGERMGELGERLEKELGDTGKWEEFGERMGSWASVWARRSRVPEACASTSSSSFPVRSARGWASSSRRRHRSFGVSWEVTRIAACWSARCCPEPRPRRPGCVPAT